LTTEEQKKYNDTIKIIKNKLWKTIDNIRLFSYNNQNRISETIRLEYVKLIDNRKKNNN
jgi:hypothetical protein